MQTKPDIAPEEQPDAPDAPAFDITEADIDEVLAACSGDPRAAIRALLIGQQFLEAALEEARKEASWGYVRGRPSRWTKDAPEG